MEASAMCFHQGGVPMNPLRYKFYFISVLMLLYPSWSLAYTVVLKSGQTLDDKTLLDQEDAAQMSYGMTTVSYRKVAVERVQLEHPVRPINPEVSLVTVAEASIQPTHDIIQTYLKAHHSIKNAWTINEIEPFVTKHYYQSLVDKKAQGAHDVVLLELIRGLLPDEPMVSDSFVDDNRAQLATSAKGHWGETKGVINMIQEDGLWKIQQQRWYAEESRLKELTPLLSVHTTYNPDKITKENKVAFERGVSSYKFSRNPLALSKTRARSKLPKDAFVLVFYMKKGEKLKKRLQDPYPDDENKKPRLHLVWTGPKQAVPQQTTYSNKYPLDISIANESEGYLSDNVNLRFPKKKPRGITVEFLFEF